MESFPDFQDFDKEVQEAILKHFLGLLKAITLTFPRFINLEILYTSLDHSFTMSNYENLSDSQKSIIYNYIHMAQTILQLVTSNGKILSKPFQITFRATPKLEKRNKKNDYSHLFIELYQDIGILSKDYTEMDLIKLGGKKNYLPNKVMNFISKLQEKLFDNIIFEILPTKQEKIEEEFTSLSL